MTELEFLKSKGLIKKGFTEFVISGDFGKIELTQLLREYKRKKIQSISYSSKNKKVSSDGVLFRCDNCGFEPKMKSNTDDLLQMHFCPKCGCEFE